MASKTLTITGGEGRMGRRLVKRFVEAGYNVKSVGLHEWLDAPCAHTIADLRNYGDAVQMVRGSDAVLHLAADSSYPPLVATQELYDNVSTAFNVFLAAARADEVQRVVWASSTHSSGQPFSASHAIAKVPLVESDFYSANDVYGLSKRLGESMLEHRALWGSTELLALRVSFGYEVDDYPYTYEGRWDHAAPMGERLIALRDLWEKSDERESNLWGYVDGRDVFQAFQLAVESKKDLSGEILFITAADTVMSTPTRQLVEEHFPDATVADDLPEYGSFYSTARAKDVLGYVPEHSWRSVIQEQTTT